jgi:hypothetical protein
MLFPELRAEWQEIATKHIDIKSFLFGTAERLLGSNRSAIEYPLIMLEAPNSSLEGQNDTPLLAYSLDFSVLVQARSGDYVGENSAWDLAQTITLDIIAYLRQKHSKKGTPRYDYANVRMEVFDRFTTDNLFGLHVQIPLITCQKLAYNPAKWTT